MIEAMSHVDAAVHLLSASEDLLDESLSLKKLHATILLMNFKQAESAADSQALVSLVPFAPALDLQNRMKFAVALRKAGELGDASRLFMAIVHDHPKNYEIYREAAATLKRARQHGTLAELVAFAEENLAGDDAGDAMLMRLRQYLPANADDMAATKSLQTRVRHGEVDDGNVCVSLAESSFTEGLMSATAFYLRRARELGSDSPVIRALSRHVAAFALAVDETAEALARRYEENDFEETFFAPEDMYRRLVEQTASHKATGGEGLLLVVNSFSIGGSERNAITMANEFAKRKDFPWVKIAAIQETKSSSFADLLDPRVEILSLAKFDGDIAGIAPSEEVQRALAAVTPTNSRVVIAKLLQLLYELRPAIVHAYAADVRAIQTAAAAACAGIPVIMNPGGFTPTGRGRGEEYRINDRWMRATYRSLLDHPRIRMLNCSLAAVVDYHNWIGAERTKFGVNYYGLREEERVPSPSRVEAHRKAYRLEPHDFIVGGVFRFEEVKRPLLWIETAAEVAKADPAIKFVLLGSGSLLPAARERAEQLGIADRCIFAGSQLDPENWYALMSVYLQTSSSEGLGNVLLEAQSYGVPIVVPLIGGMPETLVHGRTGWVVDEDDAESLAQRLLWVRQHPEWRAEASRYASQFITERYSRDRMINDSLRAYAALSENHAV